MRTVCYPSVDFFADAGPALKKSHSESEDQSARYPHLRTRILAFRSIMSHSVEAIISDLEFLCMGNSYKNSVQSSDGSLVALDRTLWASSAVLREHVSKGTSYLKLSVPESSLHSLLRAHRDGVLPNDLKTLLDLLAVSHQLQLRDLESRCFDVLCTMKAFSELEFPPECSTETVMECFKALLGCPLRTADIYKEQLDRIARHCDNDQAVMMNALNLVKEKLGEFVGFGLDGVPLGFDVRKTMIIVQERQQRIQTTVFDGSTLIPVNVFGKYFDPRFLPTGSILYLKYGSYVLYKSGTSLYRKSLRDDSNAVEILRGCTKVVAKSNFVFALKTECKRTSVFLWVDDERFKRIWRNESEVTELDFESENRILVIARFPKNISFYRLQNQVLAPLDDKQRETMEHCIDFTMRQKFSRLRTRVATSNELKIHWMLRTYRMISSNHLVQTKLAHRTHDSQKNLTQTFWSLFECGTCELRGILRGTNFVDRGSLMSVGDNLYVTKDFPSPRVTITIPVGGSRHSLLDFPLSF